MDYSVFVVPGIMMLLGSAVTFAFTRRTEKIKDSGEKVKADDELKKRVAELEGQLLVVKEKVVPISAAFQAILIKELTHFHMPVMDKLLEKLGPPNTLTEAEEKKLALLLQQRSVDLNGRISDLEQDAAVMLPMVVKRVHAEMKVDPTKQDLQVVAVDPSKTEEKK